MEFREVLYSRYSCRSFRPDPVDKKTMLAILEDASRTPSWANTQPWELFVAAGGVLKSINDQFLENAKNGIKDNPDLPVPTHWPVAENNRIRQLFESIFTVADDVPAQLRDFNASFYHAPAVIYICMNKTLTSWSVLDLGALSQSIMLSAVDHGLATIPAVNLVKYPEIIRKALGIPGDYSVVLGVAIGYEDATVALNRFRTSRKSFDAGRLKGF